MIDHSGYIVMHPDFIGASGFETMLVENVHITVKVRATFHWQTEIIGIHLHLQVEEICVCILQEEVIAKQLLIEGDMIKKSCVGTYGPTRYSTLLY